MDNNFENVNEQITKEETSIPVEGNVQPSVVSTPTEVTNNKKSNKSIIVILVVLLLIVAVVAAVLLLTKKDKKGDNTTTTTTIKAGDSTEVLSDPDEAVFGCLEDDNVGFLKDGKLYLLNYNNEKPTHRMRYKVSELVEEETYDIVYVTDDVRQLFVSRKTQGPPEVGFYLTNSGDVYKFVLCRYDSSGTATDLNDGEVKKIDELKNIKTIHDFSSGAVFEDNDNNLILLNRGSTDKGLVVYDQKNKNGKNLVGNDKIELVLKEVVKSAEQYSDYDDGPQNWDIHFKVLVNGVEVDSDVLYDYLDTFNEVDDVDVFMIQYEKNGDSYIFKDNVN